MEFISSDFNWQKHANAVRPLQVIIVGAGIAGLTAGLGFKQTGHNVTILEQVHEIAEVGAGIQVAPNAARILARFGVLEEVLKDATLVEKNSLRRYANDEELGTAPLMPTIGAKYGAPLSVIHRGDLQRILLNAAKKAGVEIRTATKVVAVDPKFNARVRTKDGEWVRGDVIIAADGIKSDIRRQIAASHGHRDFSLPTGDAAYRVLIPKARMEHDERALKLLNANVGMRWMGPGGHIMAYPIKRNTVYNMVLLHPAKPHQTGEESWTNKGDKKEMMDFYKDWSNLVQDLLSYVPEGEVMEWTLNSHKPLPSWIENEVALIGDSSHPMLPYVAQGAANAVEDAGVLVAAFTQTDNVNKALQVYQELRKNRGEKIQQSADLTRRSLHLPDGPEQRKRDDAIRAASQGSDQANPDLWSDEHFQNFMWGVDVMRDCVEKWDELVSKTEGHHLHGVSAATYL